MDEEESPSARRRRLARERQARCRARRAELRLNESVEETQRRQRANAESQRRRRLNETEEETQKRQRLVADSHYIRTLNESVEETQTRRRANAESQRRRRINETEEETQRRRRAHAELQRQRRINETEEESERRRRIDADSRYIRRLDEAVEESQQRLRANYELQFFNEDDFEEHTCGPLNIICCFCNSRNFLGERPPDRKFTSCCRKGKVKLEKPTDTDHNILSYPSMLQDLLSNPDHPHFRNFSDNIRSYNSALSFASMGAKTVDFRGRGPYIFKVHGQIYHRTSHVHPVDGQTPQYAQLYVLDSTQATDIRVAQAANEACIPGILDDIDRFLRRHNRLCATYRMLRDVEAMQQANEAVEEINFVNLVFKRDRRSDTRRYNAPLQNEIAMVFVDRDGEPPFERDIRVYPVNPENPAQPFININILSPNLDPMCYPLLFPYGEPGWQPNWHCEAYGGVQQNHRRVNVSMLQYKAALLAIREDFNPILSAGKLTQQWIVDSYLQVEANNLNFIRMHQSRLRAELYQGLADHMENNSENSNVRPGVRVILPSSFEGSPRNMRERCSDAMSIFAKYGPPDLFITFTANPKWPEITDNLHRGEVHANRPDLVARVFKLKLKSLMKDLTIHGVLGKTRAYVYTIEFQKRGLPHAHILITLETEDKFSNSERIDRFVCAEIPKVDEHPRLHEIVKRCMIHGPCGELNPQAPCMESNNCRKNFPKDFQPQTICSVNSYPKYRRCEGVTAVVRGKVMDNRYVVPYNPYLLLKYNAHINVEVCTSLLGVKYIYKYVHKGFDCANVVFVNNENDEIANYIDARYVSAPEAMWRLLEFPMHDRSHAVMRLPVHLPNQQRVTFQVGHEQEALEAARTGRTKLESWFHLNSTEPEAQPLLYVDIPHTYVYSTNAWKKRQRGGSKIIGRMYLVSVKDEERFYLRMLLLHVPGATSFEFLRTVDNVVYDTFKEAAFHRHLLDSDEEWNLCLQDARTYQMPKVMRQTFCYILCFCNPTNCLQLWNTFCIDMSLDYLRNNPEPIALNFALHDINVTLQQHQLTCASFGLPLPTGNPFVTPLWNTVHEREEAERKISTLNGEQLTAFNTISKAIYNCNERNRYFYLDGPGGSGKTYLYSTLLSFVRGKGDICLPFATTGIAATLMQGGRTVHSGFKLPVPILDTSVSSMRPTSKEADVLRNAVLIIIDEVTMLTKDGLRCIDLLLQEVMNNDRPFGGKVMVIGGDFRQTLPVVRRGSRMDIIETCIRSSPLWSIFHRITLSQNMRSCGDNLHNSWLLDIGSGMVNETDGLPSDCIEIPNQMIENRKLTDVIYGEDLNCVETDELAKRVILATTNKKTLEMNQEIISKLQGTSHIYTSSDSIVSEDPNDTLNYPPEFLYEQTPSGMPPHILELKVGVIVMLLRNLNPNKGLCNGTRLCITGLKENIIQAKILSECNRGDFVILSRINLAPSDVALPFVLKRRQFPIIPAYAMTINKAQGQTFQSVGLQLDEPVFSHGQLYVAMSRCRNANKVKVFIKNTHEQGTLLNDDRSFTKNIVYREVI